MDIPGDASGPKPGVTGCLGMLAVCLGILTGLHFMLLDGMDGVLLALFFPPDTEYASGYSDWRFRSVKVGMEMKEVEGLLGKPLDVSTAVDDASSGRVYWFYSRSSRGTHYRYRSVCFGPEGKVISKLSEFYVD